MRVDRLLLWLLPSSIVACSSGVVVLSADRHCWAVPWLCHGTEQLLELAISEFLVLPLALILLGRGLHAGALQVRRTHAALRQVLGLPRAAMPTPLVDLARKLGIERRLDLVDCASLDAFCYGLIRTRICLTAGLLDILSPAELEAVLRHEHHHLRRRDPLRALLWTMLDAACWWMENGSEHADLQRELAADRAVIRAGRRWSLACALVKLLAHTSRRAVPQHELAISGLSVTDARIDQLLHPEHMLQARTPIHRWLALPVVVALTLFACSF